MFCIALVLLLQCLFGSSGYTTFKVGSPEFVQLDLFESLHLYNSSYRGISLGMGVHTLSPGVIFTGDARETMVRSDLLERVKGKFMEISSDDFTISAIIKQNPNNVGTLLSFSRGLISALEIQSSGRKNELRVISGSIVETFPFRLADGSWHRLAISFSSTQVDVLVDCNPLYRRVLKFDPTSAIFDPRNISLWIGQRTSSNFLYQGVMQDLRLTFGPYGYLSQCPQMDSTCPTCSDYTHLKHSFASLQSQFQILADRLNKAEERLSNVEQCECQKSCVVNETKVFSDGSTWEENCDICKCSKGEAECHKKECPASQCKNPLIRPGECCPICLKKCFFKQKLYEHGEEMTLRECVVCNCSNGSMQCINQDPLTSCPPLSCSLSEQISVPGECCKICPGTDHCASQGGSKCHGNATCVNLQTQFTCQCKSGFVGDGVRECEDVDECLLERNHCSRNTVCVNRVGNYSCECTPGYRKLNNQFECEDEDECSSGTNNCHFHATCLNTKGSYSCACKEGYEGDGVNCSPICPRGCGNGGICLGPNVCSCRAGWSGPTCETDIDECYEITKSAPNNSSALCPPNASCVNKPGWFLCECNEGFKAVILQNGGAQCQDIDECQEAAHEPCSEGLQCFNTIGSYECHCLESNHECSINCFEGGRSYRSGSTWFSSDCSVCTCSSPGTTTCHPSSSDSCSQLCPPSSSSSSHACCGMNCNETPTSNNSSSPPPKSCPHQLYPQTILKSGEIWHFQCQTCECINGEIDCWKLDCPPTSCSKPIIPEGDCCPRCPDDKCTHWHRNNTYADCNLFESRIESGAQITLPHNHCFSCKCQVPLCAKSVSYNDGICVLRMENSVALMITIVWLTLQLILMRLS